jgi:hypothetical protein
MDIFVQGWYCRVDKMSEFGSDGGFGQQHQHGGGVNKNLTADEDLIMEQILENIHTTPLGQVLKKIASLPEVRKEKILDIRQQLTEGKYNLSERLDIVLDKVLEDLTT